MNTNQGKQINTDTLIDLFHDKIWDDKIIIFNYWKQNNQDLR